MSENINKLYGKPLQLLIVEALNRLNIANKEKATLKEISIQIIKNRPDLIQFANTRYLKEKLNKRILNTIKQLEQAELIKTELIKVKEINVVYYLIFTKIL